MAKTKTDDAPAAATAAPAADEAKKKPAKKAAPDAAPAAPVTADAAATATPTQHPDDAPKKKGRKPGVPPGRGKKLRNHLKNQEQKIGREAMPLKKALQLLKSMKRAKFDETVEVHMHLGIDTTQSDQMVRGAVSLPHGLGKSKKVLVFCQGENQAKAREAGADVVGGAELVEKIQKENFLDFDVALTTQDLMGQVSRLGKILGPRGLMPTPKAGTVLPLNSDVAAAVREFKAGKIEYRADKGGNVHAGVGKLSFDEDKLVANIMTFIDQVRAVKPAGVKGHYVLGVTVSATMSPSVRLAL